MAAAFGRGVCVPWSPEFAPERKENRDAISWKNESRESQLLLREQTTIPQGWSSNPLRPTQGPLCVPRGLRWWEKMTQPNMVDIRSADELVDSLLNAGDNLVILDFYSPGCGGCRLLHPKICQLAESNPNALFLKVNYEDLKPMCKSLNINVLPFFRFYRGPQGRVCSFSCTNATIGKFKDALVKHGRERCNSSVNGPAKGLEETELLSLATNKEIHFSYPLRSSSNNKYAMTSK